MAKEFSCTAAGCEFRVRANDEDEIVQHVTEHAEEKHDMRMDRQDIVDGIKTV